MENHTSASMYIPSSRVLAKLQRRTSALSTTPTPAIEPNSATTTINSGTKDATHAGTSRAEASKGTAFHSATVTASSTDKQSSNTVASAFLVKPYYPSRTSSPPPAHAMPLDRTVNAPTPALQPTTPQRGAPPGTEASGEETLYRHRGGEEDFQESPRPQPEAPVPPPSSTTWLLPRDDLAYVFSTLTWNIDLLRLLLPHAPCPLHLPPLEAHAESVPAHSRHDAPAATSTGGTAATTARVASEAAAVSGRRVDDGPAKAPTALEHCATAAINEETAQLTQAFCEGELGSHATAAVASTGARNDLLRNEEEARAMVTATPPSSACTTTAGKHTERVACHGETISATEAPGSLDNASAAPATALATPPLTWSQYLFRGNTANVNGSDHPHSTQSLPPASAATPVVAAAAGLSHSNLAQQRSRSDSAQQQQQTAAATATAARTTAAGTTSIFHAQYLPSLEEFQRDLEAQRQQQQQQQQQAMLSATRLEQHLQQQQQQQQQHRRRRAATNKTFFYSPTPSVMSFATTATTANALLDEENDDRSISHLRHTSSGTLKQNATHSSHGVVSPGRLSYAAAVTAAAASVRSSPTASCSTTQQQQRGLGSVRLRHRISSTSSLENLCNFDNDGDVRCGGGGGTGAGLSGVSPAYFLSSANAAGSLSASVSSRPSLHQPLQQPSAMMMRAADRLRASIVSAVRDSPAPGGPPTRQVLHSSSSHNNSVKGGGGSGGASALHLHLACLRKNRSENSDDDAASSSSSSSGSEDGVHWMRSRPSSAMPSNASSPASPVASISSMSFNKMWSSVASGRATPRSSAGAAGSSLHMGHGEGLSGVYGGSLYSNSNAYAAMGGGHKGGGSRRRKKNLRRRKAASPRRRSTMRVYVPSITEGPKASTLYTAPTAEAQELLMQLQRRAVAAVAAAAPTTRCPQPSHAAPGGPRASPLSVPGTPVPSIGDSLALDAAITAQTQRWLTPAAASPSPYALSISSVGEGNLGSRNGNEHHAIHSSLLHTSTGDATSTPASLHNQQHQPQQQQQHTKVVATPGPQSGSKPTHRSSSYLDMARASLSSSTSLNSPRRVSLHPPLGLAPPAAEVTAVPRPTSLDESIAPSSVSVAEQLDALGTAAMSSGRESGGGECEDAAVHAPATPVELPKWVRERSLSALYYQPWGLELLARYEQQQQLRQQLQQQQQKQQQGGHAHAHHSHGRAATHGSTLQRLPSTTITTQTPTPPLSPPSRPSNGDRMSIQAATSSLYSNPSSINSPAVTPKLSSSTANSSHADVHQSNTLAASGATANAAPSPQRPPLLTRASLGTTYAAATASVSGSVSAASAATHTSNAVVMPHISWAAALRQPHVSTPASTSSRIPATKTMTNATTTTTTATTAPATTTWSGTGSPSQPQRRATTVPEWPPELSAAEEKDARDEEFYFFGMSGAPAVAGGSQESLTRLGEGGEGGDVNSRSSTRPPQQQQHARGYEWQPSDGLHLPTLYLSRQKRSRRRLRAYPDGPTTTRSSTARKGSSTSAAAELQNKRADARAAVAEAASDRACVSGEPHSVPLSTPSTVATSKDDLFVFGDTYRRRKAAQLYYPPPPTSWSAAAASRPSARSASMKLEKVSSNAELCLQQCDQAAPTAECTGMELDGVEADAEGIGKSTSMAEAASRLSSASWHTHSRPSSTVQQRNVDDELRDDDEWQQQQQRQQVRLPQPAAASRESSKEAAAAGDGSAAAAAAAPAAATATSSVSLRAQQHSQSPLHTVATTPEIDINFFLQKFLRAVMIIVITQVRLQEQKEQQQWQQRQHDHIIRSDGGYWMDTCPPSPYGFDGLVQCRDPAGDAHLRSVSQTGRGSGSSPGSGGDLSSVERHALAFVRHHMSDYRAIMTTYVMRDEKEVARRSAQSIFTEDAEATHGPPRSRDPVDATEPAGDPLFDQRVCANCLNSTRVNAVYEAAVAANGGDYTEAAATTAVDDVEALRTAAVFISGKDAAWQPLLMELLQVSRMVQCYADGPPQPMTTTMTSTTPRAATAEVGTSSTPQQHLLASLERFLAQPTLPLLRGKAETKATPPSPLVTVMDSAADLPPAQAAAAAEMTEVSDAFRQYLLIGYLKDPSASTIGAEDSGAPVRSPHAFGLPALSPSYPSPLSPQGYDPSPPPLLRPLTWYPYAYMPGTASPYAEHTDPSRTPISAAQAADASAMTLYVTTLPLSGRLIWKWVIPAEDTDTFNLSVFFQSSLFSFLQGGVLPMPTNVCVAPSGGRMAPLAPTMMAMMHPSSVWPPSLAASINARLHQDAMRSAAGGCEDDEGKEVALVHCSAGMHRSCGVLVAFLLWLLYQCRQVLQEEARLSVQGSGRDDALLRGALESGEGKGCDGEDEEMSIAAGSGLCGVGEEAVAPASGDSLVRSRLLQRCIHHVQQRRSIAVPIRTVQCLLQSFANELQLN